MSWSIRGTYFESCNCDAICPCRRINGVPGGRSTHGVCMGVLSWLIEEGASDGTDLSGLPVALVVRYSDDEPGSPWTWILYVDVRATDEQRAALEAIYTGRAGGDAQAHFPWAWKASELAAVRPVAFDVDLHPLPRRELALHAPPVPVLVRRAVAPPDHVQRVDAGSGVDFVMEGDNLQTRHRVELFEVGDERVLDVVGAELVQHVLERVWQSIIVIQRPGFGCQPDLLQVVCAFHAIRCFPYLLHGRQKQRDQRSNDRDYDQQLDQRKATTCVPHTIPFRSF